MGSMYFLDVLCLAAAVAVIFMGYKEKVEGDLKGRKDLHDYTEESRRALSQKEGPLYMIVGVIGVVGSLSSQDLHVLPNFLYWPCIILVFVGIIIDAIIIKKTLVKKNKFTDIDIHKKLK